MKRITLLFLFLFTQALFAQFTASDVKFFVGQGTQTAYLVVDFKDGTADRSYAWGVRFNPSDEISGNEMLQMVLDAEPNFDFDVTGGFLNMISFNSHTQASGADYWSLWTSSFGPAQFDPAGWMSSDLENGEWYGASYGFSNPSMEAPANPVAAYSSQWFKNTDITSWQGTGTNQSVVVVDFGTDINGVPNSFAIGLNYEGTLSGEAILLAIQSHVTAFSFTMNDDFVATINFGSNSQTGIWNIFQGTNLSDWTQKGTLSEVTLTNSQWLGLSFGTRRPFIPQEMTAYLDTPALTKFSVVQLFPNPAYNVLHVSAEEGFINVQIIDQNGRVVKTSKEKSIDVSALAPGIYFIQLDNGQIIQTKKFIKL